MAKSDEAKYEITRRKRLARLGKRRLAITRFLFYVVVALFLASFIIFFASVNSTLPSATAVLLVTVPLILGLLTLFVVWLFGIGPVNINHWGLWWEKEIPHGKRRGAKHIYYYQVLSIVPFLVAFFLQANIYITSLAAIFFFVVFGYTVYRSTKLLGSPFPK